MRKGLFLCALMATAMVGGTALADRSESDNKSTRGQQIKEQVLEKQRDGFAKASKQVQRDSKAPKSAIERNRPRGEVYGDQATRSNSKMRGGASAGGAAGSSKVNTPAEMRAMRQLINPMYGAYRTSQADSGTDSYGGESMVPNGKAGGTGMASKNLSATGKVNTPAEIRGAMHMVNPMYGAYRTAAADSACESYGGRSLTPAGYHNAGSNTAATRHVHFKNDKGEVMSSTKGNTATAMKNRALKNEIMGMLKAKMAEKMNIEGK